MHFSTRPVRGAGNFWTGQRAALTLTTLALLVAAIGGSGCGKAAEGPNANAPKATVTINGPNGAGGPRTNTVPAEPVMLPAVALDADLKTLDGQPFKLSELKGKVLVLDLWATWCGPCRYEVPELVKLQEEFGPRGFEVIGLDIDPDDDTPDKVRAFAEKYKINYKLAYAERELALALMRGGNIPQSIVVNRDGFIIEHLTGFHPVNTPKKIRAAIEKALQEKP
jgi:thiol-disulfide isomerase/thioredoxin